MFLTHILWFLVSIDLFSANSFPDDVTISRIGNFTESLQENMIQKPNHANLTNIYERNLNVSYQVFSEVILSAINDTNHGKGTFNPQLCIPQTDNRIPTRIGSVHRTARMLRSSVDDFCTKIITAILDYQVKLTKALTMLNSTAQAQANNF